MKNLDVALQLMTDPQATVWKMVLAGRKQYDIAKALNISEAAVSRLKSRGQRRAERYGDVFRQN